MEARWSRSLRAQGTLGDGRNRWRACQATGAEPIFIVYAGDDPIGFCFR
jgi:hypothetical protein